MSDEEFNSRSEYSCAHLTGMSVQCEIGWVYSVEDSRVDEECFHRALRITVGDNIMVARLPDSVDEIVETNHEDCEYLSLWMPYTSEEEFGLTKREAVLASLEVRSRELAHASRLHNQASRCLERQS